MKNSTVEKLKMIIEDGDISKGKLEFIKRVMGDEDCPIIFESNSKFISRELERETLKNGKDVIKKDITIIQGEVKYDDIKIISYGKFIQLTESPKEITHSGIAYIEEYKLIKNHKVLLDKKLLIFSVNNIKPVTVENYISQNIKLRDSKVFQYGYVIL